MSVCARAGGYALEAVGECVRGVLEGFERAVEGSALEAV